MTFNQNCHFDASAPSKILLDLKLVNRGVPASDQFHFATKFVRNSHSPFEICTDKVCLVPISNRCGPSVYRFTESVSLILVLLSSVIIVKKRNCVGVHKKESAWKNQNGAVYYYNNGE